ncbi:unnamed protein product [Eruca vesicaria subsp. sativa]|uniref:Uncharacterized protein n=1 Tax=Eruca vesicaria subsp. sativa TaxID=29727 RepID=A0ABC8IWJ5_ERUVS|nr:unnamed protein product [Eruca vesicaria subsp. sativa]
MKKITKKLSTKYVKLHKSRLRQDGSMKSEEDGGELFRGNHSPENEESNEKETPMVTKIMESMHRKLTLKEKPSKKNIYVDGHDDQLEGSVRNMKKRGDMDQHVDSVTHGHMDHLEDLIKGRDHKDQSEGSTRNGARHDRVDQLEGSNKNGKISQLEDVTTTPSCHVDQSEGSTKNPSDFASKKDYLDWIEYVEGSSHHCFDRSEQPYKKDNIDHDQTSVGVTDGSIEGNNDDNMLLKSSKYRKSVDDLKGYKKGKGRKVKDSLKSQMVD